jgi:hypothetical protein
MHESGDGGERAWSRGRDALAGHEVSYDRATGIERSVPPGQVFGVGRVLGTSLAVWFRNILPFLLITVLFYAPPWIWGMSLVYGEQTQDTLRAASEMLGISIFLTLPLNVLVAAALTYGVVMELNGHRASFGACIATGLVRFFPALGVGLLSWLCIGVATLALVIPGLIAMCVLYVATPVSVIEKPGVMASLSRSAALTRDRRWGIFALILVLGLANWVLTLIAPSLAAPTEPSTIEEAFDALARFLHFSFVQQVIIGSIGAVVASVSYYYLRAEKEGTSASELAAIFD